MLSRQAAALAGATARDARERRLMLAAAAGIGIGAAVVPFWPAAAIAGLLAGFAFRPEADRYYLEGFADGITAAAFEPAAAGAHVDQPDRLVEGVRAGAGEPAGWTRGTGEDAPRPPSRRFSPVGGAEPRPDLADVAGLRVGAGPPRPPVDDEGAPIAVRASTGLRAIPPAVPAGTPVQDRPARPEAGGQAARGKRSPLTGKVT